MGGGGSGSCCWPVRWSASTSSNQSNGAAQRRGTLPLSSLGRRRLHGRPGGQARPALAIVRPVSEANWAGNYHYRATRLHRPSRLEQVQEIVAAAPQVRVLGSRHSFTDLADAAELLSLDSLPADVAGDHAAGTVAFSGG